MLQQSRHSSHGLVPMPREHYGVLRDLHAIRYLIIYSSLPRQ